jgi:chromosome segregation ATPase
MDENNVTEDILDINSEIASPIASPLNEIKSSTDPEPERAQNSVSAEDEIELLQSKLAGKMEIKTTVEKTSPESEAILKPSDTLEGKQMQAVEMSRQISGKQPDVTALNDRIAQLTQENQYLSNKVKSVKSQLQTKEQDLSHTKGKLRAANTRIRDLEHALVTERLTYENTRKRVMKVDQAVDTNTIMEPPNSDHSHSEEEYYTTVQEEDEKSSQNEDLASFIPTEQRSQSALVRLGIDFDSEDEVTPATKVSLPDRTQEQTTDIRCPICGKPASSFRDQAAFHVHVNKHFLD